MIDAAVCTTSGTDSTISQLDAASGNFAPVYLTPAQVQMIGPMFLGVVLARGGSKGVPGKNIADLCGKPVIQYTLEAANKSKYLNDIVVSSDDTRTLQIAQKNGTIPIWRPDFLAQDDTPTLPALQHAVKTLETMLGVQFSYIVELRATSPLKTTEDIDGAIKLLVESGAEAVIGVTEVQEYHPSRIKYLEHGYIRDFLPETTFRRQELKPTAYVRNGSIYAFRRDTILGENPSIVGHGRALGYVMESSHSVNIDSPIDFLVAEALMKRRLDGEAD